MSGLLLLFVVVIIAFIESGSFRDNLLFARLRGKEIILKGKTISAKNPSEKWIEK